MKISKLNISLGAKTLVDINFTIKNSLAVVGQSGSGKSLSIKAILGMLPSEMICDFVYESDFELKRGETISFVPQNPFTALSPLTKIENQFIVDELKQRELFRAVGLSEDLLSRFAPELSGGQLQRAVIAMAIEKSPKLLMLDEPTTALDPASRVLILDLLKKLQENLGFRILLVTHDIESAKKLCEDIVVLKDGRVVESGKLKEVLDSPKDDYTKRLIEANFANRKFRV